ncbi:hypothetical protein M0805_001832 [Coniferiporia weirii]|nr:hypothetical protein M0805_001832 [Coniferiporia weirii]
MSSPRYLQNDLEPESLDGENLKNVLADLQTAIIKSLNILRQRSAGSGNDTSDDTGSLYTGNSGIALMFLRVAVQYEAAGLKDCLEPELQSRLPSFITDLLPSLKTHRTSHAHVSPMDTAVGPALVYILVSLSYPSLVSSGEHSSENRTAGDHWTAATKTLQIAVQVAVEDDSLGGDEVLYGRAGLLWAMLNLRSWLEVDGLASERKDDLTRIVGSQVSVIEELVDEIMEAGDSGAQLYERSGADTGLPLMWQWHGKYYLGAIHGTVGILTIILQAPRELITPHLPVISSCISALCVLVSKNDGHLPSSLPTKSHSHHLVQICHGSPGFLLLLVTFRTRFPQEWQKGWDEAETLASATIWKEGLLTKGLGVCHGIVGNAWPWLLQAHARRGTPEADIPLSRALAFLLTARGVPPLLPTESSSTFRTPDHPYSLLEGLAGTVCAWMDACVIIRERLAALAAVNGDKSGGSADNKARGVLGIPGLGGARIHSMY